MKNFNLNKLIAFFALIYFWPATFLAQSKTDISTIDTKLIKDFGDLINKGKYKESIILNRDIIIQSKKIGYENGTIQGYCNLSHIMGRLGRYKDGLSFIRLAEKENEAKKDKGMEAIIYSSKGYINNCLGLYKQTLTNFKKSLLLSEYISNVERKEKLRSFAYSNIIFLNESVSRTDSVFYYAKTAFAELDDAQNSCTMASYYIHYKKDSDSAMYYLKYAERKIKKEKLQSVYELSSLYKGFGELYEEKKKYDSAKYYYNKALEISKANKLYDRIMYSYGNLYNVAELEGNEKMEAFYLAKYTKLSDSLSKVQKIQLDFPIQQYIKENEEEYERKKRRFQYMLWGSILLSMLLLTVLIIFNRKKKKKLKKNIEEKEEEIQEKEVENQYLKNKVKEGFDEVVLLAKKNDPKFIIRFIEIYPEFYQALLKVHPDINPETLKFCAFLRLNFSTKEIADYYFITPRAVQVRKNRIRKKLGISSTEDIYTWINNLK